jgi:glycosyltransferase involved in cell wall biosynthesis
MAGAKAGVLPRKLSVILPTYNERQNIGIIIYLIDKYLAPLE